MTNLYIVGAGTHSGAGLPGVISSGKIVAIGDRVSIIFSSRFDSETKIFAPQGSDLPFGYLRKMADFFAGSTNLVKFA